MLAFKISSILFSFSLLSFTSEAAPTYSFHICSNSTFSPNPNSTYQTNLNLVLSNLSSNAVRDNGFYNTTAGQDPSYRVSGVFLCRGDIITTVCQECVANATKEIVQRCTLNKMAIIWYDECFLHYKFESMLSSTVPGICLPSSQNIAEPDRFYDFLTSSMNSSATRAANSQLEKKFATGEEKFTSSQTLYNLVQCTPDLTVSDCLTCLVGAINMLLLPRCYNGKEAGRVLLPSCNIRYEFSRFYNHTAITPPTLPPQTVAPTLPPLDPRKGKKSSLTIIFTTVPFVGLTVLISVGYCLLCRGAGKMHNTFLEQNAGIDITTMESLQFDLGTIESATNKFSDDNKIGKGGFGVVYKGTLSNGQEIAVKRLSRASRQGAVEFKNEAALVAMLQHRNLTRLLGFCLEGEEKILVYEYMPNKSLDYFLFDPQKQEQLNWSRRYKIIEGIARGILYLHQDSQLRIIHRDLKASNVLLDGDLNPKISDFGMAKIFVVDQTRGNTRRIAGTFGYMSPEYVMQGRFSVKSDVFSFGVLVLEIITGKKNGSFCQAERYQNLLSYAWKKWRDGTALELLDPALKDSYSRNEVIRCIQIGLLCVQEDPADRPTMATIDLLLSSYSVTLPLPQQPAYLVQSRVNLNIPTQALESDNLTGNPVPCSVDEASITQVCPR